MAAVWKFLPALLLIASLVVTTRAGQYPAATMWMMPAVSSVCDGTVGECLPIDNFEFEIESESNRRILQVRRRYISYGALARNNVPCSRRGASYYNCRAGAEANPYRRGCSAITLCRS